MITDQDRSGYIGASDVMYVIGNWKTKSWEKWWRTKLGIFSGRFDNEYTLAGTNWEHKILDSLHLPDLEKDRQFIREEILLRVNLDGNTVSRIKEVKTYKLEGQKWTRIATPVCGLVRNDSTYVPPQKYINQVQVQMYGSGFREADIVAYGLVEEDYKNYLRGVDPQRLRQIPIAYDPNWIETVYLPRHRVLADCLRRRQWPNA